MVDRDRQIVRHIAIHGLTTRESLRESLFPDASLNAVTKVLLRMMASGYLISYPLLGRMCYYRLAGELALGPAELSTLYAAEQHCVFDGLTRLTIAELRRNHPYFPTNTPFATKDGITYRLRVDLGAESKSIAAKLRYSHEKLMLKKSYAELVEKGLFGVRVLTATDTKAEDLQRHLVTLPFPVVLSVVDALFPLLGVLTRVKSCTK